MKPRLTTFAYQYLAGPLDREGVLGRFEQGNCRLAVQEFAVVFAGKFFDEEALLNPGGYRGTGEFLKRAYSDTFFDDLPFGAVVYAEILRNKHGEAVDRSRAAFATEDDYLIRLHTAIYIPTVTEDVLTKLPTTTPLHWLGQPAIWHASAVEGGSAIWPVERFLENYHPVAAKRFW